MRHMVPVFHEVAKQLETAIKLSIANGTQEIVILQWMTRAALEMIGRSGLGYSFEPLAEGAEPHPYSKAVKDLVPLTGTLRFQRMYLLPTLYKIGSRRFRRFVVDLLPWKKIQDLRDIVNLMDQTMVRISKRKKRLSKRATRRCQRGLTKAKIS